MLLKNNELSRQSWGRYLYGRGYFVATSGKIKHEIIMEYIKNRDINEKVDDLAVSEML